MCTVAAVLGKVYTTPSYLEIQIQEERPRKGKITALKYTRILAYRDTYRRYAFRNTFVRHINEFRSL